MQGFRLWKWFVGCLKTCRYAFPYVAFWFLSVPFLGAFPFGVHLFAVEINGHNEKLGEAIVSDLSLYGFILSMAAVIDCSSDATRRHGGWVLFFALDAAAAAVMYFASLLDRRVSWIHRCYSRPRIAGRDWFSTSRADSNSRRSGNCHWSCTRRLYRC
jgi:hypothetical protein